MLVVVVGLVVWGVDGGGSSWGYWVGDDDHLILLR